MRPIRPVSRRRPLASLGAALALTLLGSLLLAGAERAGAQDRPPLNVVATTGMIADTVHNVAGERATVTGLMGPGVDPHLYQPTRADIAKLMRADVIFYNGLLLEGKMTDALMRVASSGRPVVAVTEQLDKSSLLAPPEFEGLYDPHVWMDPRAWTKTVDVIRDRLIEQDPDAASTYRSNAESYKSRLMDLDAYAERILSSVPENQQILVTAHDAFNYFGRRYDFEVVGIQGISTESEAGVQDIQRIVDLLVEKKIPAVFVESTISERNVRALADGARARGHSVRIGGELFSDAMGARGTYEGTYVGMIDHNVTVITRALGGDAPAGGLNARLEPGE